MSDIKTEVGLIMQGKSELSEKSQKWVISKYNQFLARIERE